MSLEPEVRRGGGLPFGMMATSWVCDPRYSLGARALYAVYVTYADTQTRDTGRGKPYRTEVAAQLGVSLDTLDRLNEELEAAGILTIERRRNPDNPKVHDVSVYTLHDADLWNGHWTDPLPPGVKAADVVKQRTAERRAAARQAKEKAAPPAQPQAGGSRTGAARGSRTGAARGSRTGAARVAAPVRPSIYSPVQSPPQQPDQQPPAPAAPRAAPPARRAATTGSGARGPRPPGGRASQADVSAGVEGPALAPAVAHLLGLVPGPLADRLTGGQYALLARALGAAYALRTIDPDSYAEHLARELDAACRGTVLAEVRQPYPWLCRVLGLQPGPVRPAQAPPGDPAAAAAAADAEAAERAGAALRARLAAEQALLDLHGGQGDA